MSHRLDDCIRMKKHSHVPFVIGLIAGCGLTIAVGELPYINWASVVPPIDQRPLIIRHDAKGRGQFFAPRSGHRHHRGLDLVAQLDSPVRAIRSGRVVQIGVHRGLGKFVELEHRGRLRSLYAHLHEIQVDVGARVRQGEVIGTVGKTGNARHPSISPHVHLEVLRDGEPIDPQRLGLLASDPAMETVVQRRVEGSPEPADASGGE